MEYEKIIFNFPKQYKRKLEKIVSMGNVENEKSTTLSGLISETLTCPRKEIPFLQVGDEFSS